MAVADFVGFLVWGQGRAGQERNERNGGGGEVPSITLVSVG